MSELRAELEAVYVHYGQNILTLDQLAERGFCDTASLVATGMLKRSAGKGFSRTWEFKKKRRPHEEGKWAR